METEVSSLHERPDLLKAAVDLLNSEWPRSESARQHAIRRSSNSLPCSLLLLAGRDTVVGFARISAVMGIADAVLVEAVVVDKSLRGRGLGRILMNAVEQFAAGQSFTTVYLSTHDKEGFYAHLGYTRSSPVSLQPMSTLNMTADQVSALASFFSVKMSPEPSTPSPGKPAEDSSAEVGQDKASNVPPTTKQLEKDTVSEATDSACAAPPLPPPPPPPPPQLAKPTPNSAKSDLPIIWMRKPVSAS